jgi:ribosomal protein S18 acetylase RimI-like enzyme
MPDYQIRTMTRDEVDLAVEWAAQEGWNPGLHDADSFFSTDCQGFLLGELDGEPIASISVVAYDATFGFLGFYIVKPQYRGQGYGLQLWNAGMAYLADRNIGLDGVIEQQENYKKSGFKLAYSNIRYEGLIPGVASKNLSLAAEVPFDALVQYDAACFPVQRESFLQSWLSLPNAVSLVKTANNRITGYGTIRSCRSGYKIGPLFADDPATAEELFLSLCVETKENPVYLDVPEIHPQAVQIAENYAMRKVFGTARMYTQEQPAMALDKIYGVTTFELG